MSITNSQLNGDATNSNITTGTLTISNNTTNKVTIGNVAGKVDMANGTLSMKAAMGDVFISGGTVSSLTTVGGELNISGGTVTQGGAITKNVTISNNATLIGNNGGIDTDIGGNLNNSGITKVHNVTGDVIMANGTLSINEAGANMTVSSGTVNDLTKVTGNLTIGDSSTEKTATVNINGNIGGDVSLVHAIRGNAILNGSPNIGGKLEMSASSGHQATVNNVIGDVTMENGTLSINEVGGKLTVDERGTVSGLTKVGENLPANSDALVIGPFAIVDIDGPILGNAVVKYIGFNGERYGRLNGTAKTDITGNLNNDGITKVHNVTGDVIMENGTLSINEAGANMTVSFGTVNDLTKVTGNLTI